MISLSEQMNSEDMSFCQFDDRRRLIYLSIKDADDMKKIKLY
jgi:hypothetical protein